MDRFIEKHKLPTLTLKKIDNLTRLMAKERKLSYL